MWKMRHHLQLQKMTDKIDHKVIADDILHALEVLFPKISIQFGSCLSNLQEDDFRHLDVYGLKSDIDFKKKKCFKRVKAKIINILRSPRKIENPC